MRQSQDDCLSRIVLTHASRQAWSRLTFDVRQKKKILSYMIHARIVGCCLIFSSILIAASQAYFLFNLAPHPMLPDFSAAYAWKSSLQNFGFAIVALMIGGTMTYSSSRYAGYVGLLVSILGCWIYVGSELWSHFFVLPKISADYLSTHSYFDFDSAPSLLLRILLHLLFPLAFGLSCVIVSKRSHATYDTKQY